MKRFSIAFLIFYFMSQAVLADSNLNLIENLYKKLKLLMSQSLNYNQYVFSPKELAKIAQMGKGKALDERWNMMLAQMRRNHPNVYISPKLHWIFNQAGNVIGEIAIVYASAHEYVAFFGTPIGGRGFSGRYPGSEVYDIMVAGKMEDYLPGEMQSEVYDKPGATEILHQTEAKGMVYSKDTWMIDYARGDLISMFPFGVIAPAAYQTLDYSTAATTIKEYLIQLSHNGF